MNQDIKITYDERNAEVILRRDDLQVHPFMMKESEMEMFLISLLNIDKYREFAIKILEEEGFIRRSHDL